MHLSRILVIIYQLSVIHGELEINVLSDSYCLLQVYNETDTESSVIVNETRIAKTSALTVYGNISRSCDLQITGLPSSQHAQIGISVVAGKMTGLDYIYVGRTGPNTICSDQFVTFMGLMKPCTLYFAIGVIQLHFRGDIVLGIHYGTIAKDNFQGYSKDGNHEDRVDALEGQTSNCKQIKMFNSVIQCVGINHPWWEYDETFQFDSILFKPAPSTRCDLQCPHNCSCMLSDRQVVYNCPKIYQQLDQNYSSFVLFSTDISRLDLTKNRITALIINSFTSIGNHI